MITTPSRESSDHIKNNCQQLLGVESDTINSDATSVTVAPSTQIYSFANSHADHAHSQHSIQMNSSYASASFSLEHKDPMYGNEVMGSTNFYCNTAPDSNVTEAFRFPITSKTIFSTK